MIHDDLIEEIARRKERAEVFAGACVDIEGATYWDGHFAALDGLKDWVSENETHDDEDGNGMARRYGKPGEGYWIRPDLVEDEGLHPLVWWAGQKIQTSWDSLRTDSDFISDQDQAIVTAAVEWYRSRDSLPDYWEANAKQILIGVIEEKLDAEKPRTAEEVIAQAWPGYLPESEGVARAVEALREAGLLKE